MNNIQTKICNTCGIEKNVCCFYSKGNGYYDSRCKVCTWIKKHNEVWEKFNHNEKQLYKNILIYIIDYQLNLNEVSEVLNIDIKTICDIVTNKLKLGGKLKFKVIIQCDYCNTDIEKKSSEVLMFNNYFCSKECHNMYMKINPTNKKRIYEKKCLFCGQSFIVSGHTKKKKYCSNKCYIKSKENKISINCVVCGKERLVKKSTIGKITTCSKQCAKIRHSQQQMKKSIENTVIKNCIYCNKEYKVINSQAEESRYCSLECKAKWQREYLKGENHPLFSQQLITCTWCGNEFYKKLSKINKQKHHFCSVACRQEWFINICSKSKEWREKSRKRIIKYMEKGSFKKFDTIPQKRVNEWLNQLGIKYINEQGFNFYTIDNYLIDFNGCIEVMGTFWHVDPRKYKHIISKIQLKRIYRDKAKNRFFKNQYSINILYLWEYDILNNPTICIELIKQYIFNNCKLKDYHSFNYILKNGQLILNDEIIKPYMDWTNENIKNIVDLNKIKA